MSIGNMKISLFELESWQEEYFTSTLPKHELLFEKKALTTRNVKKALSCKSNSYFHILKNN